HRLESRQRRGAGRGPGFPPCAGEHDRGRYVEHPTQRHRRARPRPAEGAGARTGGRRVPDGDALNADRVLAATLSRIRGQGMAGLSMRGLAEDLGVGLATAYHHVPGPTELILPATDARLSRVRL